MRAEIRGLCGATTGDVEAMVRRVLCIDTASRRLISVLDSGWKTNGRASRKSKVCKGPYLTLAKLQPRRPPGAHGARDPQDPWSRRSYVRRWLCWYQGASFSLLAFHYFL